MEANNIVVVPATPWGTVEAWHFFLECSAMPLLFPGPCVRVLATVCSNHGPTAMFSEHAYFSGVFHRGSSGNFPLGPNNHLVNILPLKTVENLIN